MVEKQYRGRVRLGVGWIPSRPPPATPWLKTRHGVVTGLSDQIQPDCPGRQGRNWASLVSIGWLRLARTARVRSSAMISVAPFSTPSRTCRTTSAGWDLAASAPALVFDFTLTDTEMETLDALDENLVTAWDPATTP